MVDFLAGKAMGNRAGSSLTIERPGTCKTDSTIRRGWLFFTSSTTTAMAILPAIIPSINGIIISRQLGHGKTA
jgi:hypothetical protein